MHPIVAIIVAAGRGQRMQHRQRKQYLPLAGRPILTHTLQIFDACQDVSQLVVVIPGEDITFCQRHVIGPFALRRPVRLVAGGAERQESVYNGLVAAEGQAHTVVIHDGVRPFIRCRQIWACCERAQTTGACILAAPVRDTLKRRDPGAQRMVTVDRSAVWQAQTPQVFTYALIRQAHEAARREGIRATDDAALVERLGKEVKVLEGSPWNFKITTPEDLAVAERLMQGDRPF